MTYAKLTAAYLQDRRPCLGDANADARTSAFVVSKRWLASRCGANCQSDRVGDFLAPVPNGAVRDRSGDSPLSIPLTTNVAFGSCVTNTSPEKEVWSCTGDEGRPLEAGIQVQASNHCKLLSLRAMVVSVAGKVGTKIPAGKVRRGERKQTVDDVS
jgi:hypothetical protein